MDVPQELVQAIASGDAVLFIGAGLSIGAGLPGWSELLTSLADEAGVPPDRRQDPLQVAQRCENALKRHGLLAHVCRATDTSGTAPTENHRRLLDLGLDTWVTTNYDDLLERALQDAGRRYVKVVRDENLPYTTRDAVTVIKLHGECEQPDTIVLTQDDYATFFRRYDLVRTKLRALLAEKTFLFIGYGINDPDFNQIRSEIAYDLQEHQRRAYAVVFDDDESDLDLLRSRNIYPLYIATAGPGEYDERLGEWLDELIGRTGHAPGPAPAPSPEREAQPLHQLPRPPADFTGRAEEVAELEGVLSRETLLMLSGIGGSGKGALARVLADRVKARYPDAQLYLDLQGTSEEPLTAAGAMVELLCAFHRRDSLPTNERQLQALYRSTLDGKRALLVLKDAKDGEQVEPLIPPKGCAMIVTSRVSFTLPGCQHHRVGELSERDAAGFLLRLAPRIGEDAEEMARLLGCLPYALRLAGSALAEREDLPVDEYLERLRSSAEERLKLAEAPLRLSYDLLAEALQERWRALAVFPGTFDRAAAAVVWDVEPAEAQEALSELVRYSLVGWDPNARRYRLKPLAHDYAEARFDDRARPAVERRHAAHYAQVLREANELYKQGGEDAQKGMARFDAERANVEAGQAWAERATKDKDAPRLCVEYARAGADLLSLRLKPEERIAWLETALAALPKFGDRSAEQDLLGDLGNAHRERGEVERAIDDYEQALRAARRNHDQGGIGYWQGRLGHAYIVKGRSLEAGEGSDWFARAIEQCQEALAIAEELGDRKATGIHLGNLGSAHLGRGEYLEAIDDHQRAVDIAREIKNRRGEGAALGNLGYAYRGMGKTDEAIGCYRQALAIAREICDRWNEARHSWNLGELYEFSDPRRAVELMSVRVAYEREIGHQRAEEHAERVEQIRQQITPQT